FRLELLLTLGRSRLPKRFQSSGGTLPLTRRVRVAVTGSTMTPTSPPARRGSSPPVVSAPGSPGFGTRRSVGPAVDGLGALLSALARSFCKRNMSASKVTSSGDRPSLNQILWYEPSA